MELQHVNIKFHADDATAVDTGQAIPVFHRWIQNKVTGELLIDVADYRHVPDGPGVVLVAHEAHYALDSTHGEFGLLYNRRTALDGSNQEKLQQAYDAALAACTRLEEEPEFRGHLRFNRGHVEVIINDRALAPNTDASFDELKPDLTQFFDQLFSPGAYTLERLGEPRERLRIAVYLKPEDSAFTA